MSVLVKIDGKIQCGSFTNININISQKQKEICRFNVGIR